jgi:hypothetical protein
MPPRNNRCSACRGSGACQQCHGAGVNVHFNDAEPRCRACLGTGNCSECAGTGSFKRTTIADLDIPVALRIALSVIPAFILSRILIAHEPTHLGRGGPILPNIVDQLICMGTCGLVLYGIWKGAKLADFKRRENSGTISLFGRIETQSPSKPLERTNPPDRGYR